MKEIIAIVRMNRVNVTKKALANAGFCGMNVMKALGRGQAPLESFIMDSQGLKEEYGAMVTDRLESGGRLIPKRVFSLLVDDQQVETAVEAFLSTNSTGQAGDGKIFICPVLDVVRIRTGERGDAAI